MTTMLAAADIDVERPFVTAGDIAAINLESARLRSWSRFWRAPEQPGIAELIVEQEQLTAQFIGDLAAFDRLEMLVDELQRVDVESTRTNLIAAQVACSLHRFAEARTAITLAVAAGAPVEATDRLLLTIDQATGTNLPAVLAARRDRAARRGHWDERIPLGALLADMGAIDEAERTYLDALHTYPDVSPFAPAWVSFQLGMLWGECAPAPDAERAATWYRAAIAYLPSYVKARVHLAEIQLDLGHPRDAIDTLMPVLASGDPEVQWRMADARKAAGDAAAASDCLDSARTGFEGLVARHELAFADHAAEFYLGGGDDANRALELARVNLANRSTRRSAELFANANARNGASPCRTAAPS